MTCSTPTRLRIASAVAAVLAVLLMPVLCLSGEEKKSDIPSALALKLSRIRKALPREKVTHISKWPMREQRRYLLYVEDIAKFPDKLWGEDTVEKLVPPEDLAVVKTWPEQDRVRIAHYFKDKKKDPSPITEEELKRGLAELPGEERATVGLMLPSDQKNYLTVRATMKAMKTPRPTPRRRRPVPSAKPVVSAKKDNAEEPAGGEGSGVAIVVIIVAICVAAAVAAVVVATRKRPHAKELEEV
jgi:hypothetical protein